MVIRDVKDEVHWTVTASPEPKYLELSGSHDVDVLIVGGGLTGCRTALGLADSGVSVALVDAREIGWGSSGRSGGQCNPIWRQTPQQLEEIAGCHPWQKPGQNYPTRCRRLVFGY